MKKEKDNQLQENLLLHLQETHRHYEKKMEKLKTRKIKKEQKLALKLQKKCGRIQNKADRKNIRLCDENGQKILVIYKKMYTLGEELFNAISHGVGAGLSVAAIVLILIKSVTEKDLYKIGAGVVYGVTLFTLYLMSTLYHALTHRRAKAVFRVFDHCSIFFLIAGTYTPYLLITMRGTLWGPILFIFVWILTILGIVLNSVSLKRFKVFSMISYVALGWCIVLSVKDLFRLMPPAGLILLFAGGLSYTGGIVFFALHKYKYMHSIWHLFVLAGSVLHFFSLYYYVF